MESDHKPAASLAFGRFRVLPHRRELLADGQPLKLGGRAYDILMALIEARGAIVSRDALMARVWPDRIVEENALQVQMSALRAALGPERALIRTVAGRGYMFAGEIRLLPAAGDQPDDAHRTAAGLRSAPPATNLLAPVSELIGRDDALREVVGLTASHRLVTLTGAGGIGKTRLAFAAARHLLPQFPDGAWVADLAPLADPGLVPTTVLAAAGLEPGAGATSPERAAKALTGKQLLLVLDNCEHVIAAAAAMAESVLRTGSQVRIIATSREPLRVEGEWVYGVPTLSVPADDAEDADGFQRYGAVRLFLDRVWAAAPRVVLDQRATAATALICRRLDGIPLAIELAAGRATTLGLEELADRLGDRFHLLTGGRRTALPRHRTLRATLDWSFDLLPEPERVILRRLSIFAGLFSLKAASAVVADIELTPSEVVEGIANLAAKSLVSANSDAGTMRYRLLDTTRAYALEKLGESGERERLARRHAEYYRDLFEQAETEWQTRPTAEWLAKYGRQIDNLRVALDWAFSPAGHAPIGVALTAAAVPLLTHMSLLEECRVRVERALAAIGTGVGPDPPREMKLHAALGASVLYTKGAVPEVGAAWTVALEIAESLDDTGHRLRALVGLFNFHLNSGRSLVSLALAERFCALAARSLDATDRLIAEQLLGVSKHLSGNQLGARHHFERIVADAATLDRRSLSNRLQIDLRVWARVFLAWTLWLQGFPDRAMHAVGSSLEDARAADHTMSLCFALARGACPIALLMGDLAAAEHYVEILLDNSTRHGPAHWRAIGRSQQGVLAIRRGDPVNGMRLLQANIDDLGNNSSITVRLVKLLIAEALSRAGLIVDGLAAIEEALAWTQRSEEQWLIAELLRVKGDLLLSQGGPGTAATAENHFRQALDWARRQGALSWELRADTSFARLLHQQGRPGDAEALLQPVYDRFTEGFETADLKAARALLGPASRPETRLS
ncbi:MAG TPA: winged helix-turn-helix domain-containing protein [Acetobacteraceae bacterium]|nr:winged helix-turn-helix domain-containing protein [Acetobacteraceae bacterium]